MRQLSPDSMDRRADTREALRQPVRAYFGENLGLWADCELRDLSVTGAKIHLSALYKLPPRFILLLHQTGIAFEVVLKWRRGDLAGLSFEVRHELETSQEKRLAPIREAWIGLRRA
jgi:PilZ domain